MSYVEYLIHAPLFWAALAGLSLGGATASATSRDRRAGRTRGRKWTVMFLFLSFAVAAVVCGVIVPGGWDLFRLPSAYVAAGSLLYFGLALRFPRAAGLPALLALSVVVVASVAVMRPWLPVRGSTVVAQARVLSADADGYHVELADFTPGVDATFPTVTRVGGLTLEPVVDLFEISPYLFFLGTDRGVRLVSVTPEPAGAPPPESRFVAGLTPLLRIERTVAPAVRVNLLRSYRVVADRGEPVIKVQAIAE